MDENFQSAALAQLLADAAAKSWQPGTKTVADLSQACNRIRAALHEEISVEERAKAQGEALADKIDSELRGVALEELSDRVMMMLPRDYQVISWCRQRANEIMTASRAVQVATAVQTIVDGMRALEKIGGKKALDAAMQVIKLDTPSAMSSTSAPSVNT